MSSIFYKLNLYFLFANKKTPALCSNTAGMDSVEAVCAPADELLAAIGLTREQVYIANIVKCRPPMNRDP